MALLIVTIASSLLALGIPGAVRRFAECPWEVVHQGKGYQLVTSGFLHVDLGHLAMNMITLYFFGPALERLLGGERFLALYLGSMLTGNLFALLLHYRHPHYRAIGASGAISGVLFSFVLFRPFAPIYLFLIPIGIPALLFAIGYIIVSVVGMRTRWGRIGHEAHLGGAIGGVLLTVLLYPGAVRIFLSHFR
jgi:membrane associated rhomboid family serine protease